MSPEEILEQIAELLDRHGDGLIEADGRIEAGRTFARTQLTFPGLAPENGKPVTMNLTVSIP